MRRAKRASEADSARRLARVQAGLNRRIADVITVFRERRDGDPRP